MAKLNILRVATGMLIIEADANAAPILWRLSDSGHWSRCESSDGNWESVDVTKVPDYVVGIFPSQVAAKARWCVCWYGNVADEGWAQHKGPPVTQNEAYLRLQRSMREHPHCFFWLEKA